MKPLYDSLISFSRFTIFKFIPAFYVFFFLTPEVAIERYFLALIH